MNILQNENNFGNYLGLISQLKNHVVIIAVRDTIVPSPTRTTITDEEYGKLENLGLKLIRKDNIADQFWSGYAAVISDGKVVYENLSARGEDVRYESTESGVRIQILSSPYKNQNVASILANGTECAPNERGFNFVIIHSADASIVDAVSFDTWQTEKQSFRKEKQQSINANMNTKQKEHYDVGIYGLWYGRNYGSIITYYALNEVVKDMGYSTVMIRNPLGQKELKIDTLPKSHVYHFADKQYHLAPLYPIKEMPKLNVMCDRFLLGSDQMWNYNLSKNYQQSYFFDFVSDENKKIAYAVSFGEDSYTGPENYKASVKKNMARFDAISVRDDFSKRICRDDFGVQAEQVLDPVFLCSVKRYEDLIDECNAEKKNFIFIYILDPTPEFGKEIEKIANATNMSIVVIFNEDGDKKEYKQKLALDYKDVEYWNDATVNEWLYCFKNALFIITDSFHGACFSSIFEKEFIVKKNTARGGKRFDCLLGQLGLKERMVTTPNEIGILFDKVWMTEKIDYNEKKLKIADMCRTSYNWLKKALSSDQKRTVVLKDKTIVAKLDINLCTGCAACVNICPTQALFLKQDKWGYYRSSLESEKCINCGICSNICPALSLPEKNYETITECFEFVASNKELLFSSSSGGVFSLLAKGVIKKGGVVAGCAWSEDNKFAEHILVDNENDLYKLQKSKYLQSYVGNIHTEVKKRLDEGLSVLFSGCPCQVAGLKAFLRKDYKNLFLIDLLCGNAPSSLFFRKYLEEEYPEGIREYQFRYKEEGWNANCVTTTTTTGIVEVRRGGGQDNYQRLYHSHVMCPPHCEKCKYQGLPRFGDITIGDFWGIGKYDKELNTMDGVSAILCNNEKGKALFNEIPEEAIRIKKNVPITWLGNNGFIKNGKNWISPKRDEFYDAILFMPFSKAADYALKPNRGKYSPIYEKSNSPLQFNTNFNHFHFDESVWGEIYINKKLILYVKSGQSQVGKYATLPLCYELLKGRRYTFSMSFSINTESKDINFYIKDSGSKFYQSICSYKINEVEKNGNSIIYLNKDFIPESGIYDEFMIGASQLRGTNSYIAINYINIQEKQLSN